jgi:4-diphosphocytidyl-2-C-methyl-D-erythritol kinase
MAGLGPEEQNLAVRAARAFMAEFAITAQVRIDLRKEIPAGAGLGGGSSDAGAVLRMLAQLCRIDDQSRLAALALKLGADVPFFLDPQPARVRGIGEIIEPLEQFNPLALVIVVPQVTVPTASVFKGLRHEGWRGPASHEVIEAIAAGRIQRDFLVNDLAPIAIAQWPEIASLRDSLDQAGAIGSAMSGSGGAVFGIFASDSAAASAAKSLQVQHPSARIFVATTLDQI